LAEGWEIGPREAQRRLERDRLTVLLDVRSSQERELACIAGSLHLPMEEIPRRLHELAALEDRPIIVHCHHGMRSFQVTAFLREQGFEEVLSMAGGIDLWARAVDGGVGRY
jgi:rhodanese-related sulfurtransferase